jgi:hypothetical protein
MSDVQSRNGLLEGPITPPTDAQVTAWTEAVHAYTDDPAVRADLLDALFGPLGPSRGRWGPNGWEKRGGAA